MPEPYLPDKEPGAPPSREFSTTPQCSPMTEILESLILVLGRRRSRVCQLSHCASRFYPQVIDPEIFPGFPANSMIPVDRGEGGYHRKPVSQKKENPRNRGRVRSGVKVQRKTTDAEICRTSRCANADDHLTQIARMSRIAGRAYPRDSPASSSQRHDP
jgi:hypothetical protein